MNNTDRLLVSIKWNNLLSSIVFFKGSCALYLTSVTNWYSKRCFKWKSEHMICTKYLNLMLNARLL
jgi:hypothetical protein